MNNNSLDDELSRLLTHSSAYYKDKLKRAHKLFNFNKPVILFGAQKMGVIMMALLKQNNVQLLSFCDNDRDKSGQLIDGISVINPQTLKAEYPKNTQIIISSLYDEEIKAQLNSLGFTHIWSHTYFFTIFANKFTSLAWTNDINNIFLNKELILQVFGLLGDTISKRTFINILKYRLTLERKLLQNIAIQDKKMYFDNNVFKLSDKEVFLDGGAYTGDTLTSFITATGNKFNMAYCFEPDTQSYVILSSLVSATLKDSRIKYMSVGLGEKRELAYFSDESNLQSKIVNSGKNQIQLISIDEYINIHFTLIKLDIEGYEKEALLGARQTIKKYRPKLAICSYHHQSDIWEIPLLIKKLNNKYKLYFRHYGQYLFDTICYGV